MQKEQHEVAVLGGPQGSAPVTTTTTVINMPKDISLPDHVVWSLFNTLFVNFCCLGFIAYAYSVKSRDRKMVGDVTGAQAYAPLILTAIVLIILFATKRRGRWVGPRLPGVLVGKGRGFKQGQG
uniref:Uncharacterized protein n=1 Tax=Castor canadensis TaxID=51338 RepID=A0A8C0WF45_CASCN